MISKTDLEWLVIIPDCDGMLKKILEVRSYVECAVYITMSFDQVDVANTLKLSNPR